MARKKYEEEPDHHDRWLVSYADFITLLFAFFVVMYALSSVNEGKYRVLSNSLGTAFRKDPVIPSPLIKDPVQQTFQFRTKSNAAQKQQAEAMRLEKESMTNIARDLLGALSPLVSEGKVRVTQTARGVKLEINASVLFPSGEAKLTEESGQALRAVAGILKADNHAIQVEGHTDNVPISTPGFPSNWELSSVRASSVVRLFVDSGIPESRLSAVGHGANFPVGSNDAAEGRLRNRRVEIMILSALPETVTEIPVEAPARN